MTSQDFVRLALQLATMLGFAVVFGEIMRRLHQPAVIGEMLGGLILGPTVLGWTAPAFYEWLFLASPTVTAAREASTKLGMLFFLFYAGLEVNLAELKTIGRRAILIGLIGTLLPIVAGVALVYALPRAFWGEAVQAHFFSFALFIGMNLANSANPVIARILLELDLLNKPIGALIMSATVVDDLVNWALFAVILNDIAPSAPGAGGSVAMGLALVALLFVAVLGGGRLLGPALDRVAPLVAWPSGFIAVIAVLVLLASSASEALGVHAFLGAFLIGVALSAAKEQHLEAHETIGAFVMSFAPIYFISMGMTTNFITNFDALLVVVILVVACVTKIGARAGWRQGGRHAAGPGGLGDRVRAQCARRDRHYSGWRRTDERRHRCPDLRGHCRDGDDHVADGRADAHPSSYMSAILAAGVALSAWGIAIALSGGFQFTLLGLRISSRDPFRPCVLGAICALVFLWQQRRRPAPPESATPRAHAMCAALIAIAVTVVAATCGSFVAGGSDWYGYISQADLWLAGDLQVDQPWAATLPWSDADRIASPVGYRPGLAAHTIVPTYPAGFPLLIALAKLAGLQSFVVPVLAGLLVWLTYAIGSQSTGNRLTGVVAAALMAATPAFLHQSMWAMADVPAAAFWTLVFWHGAVRPVPRPLLAGVFAGIALMIRPNLVLLAAVVPFVSWWRGDRAWKQTATFLGAMSPFVAAIAVINQLLYGAPWLTGYGEAASLFSWGNAMQNLRSYYTWIAETQTVLFLPAVLAGGALALALGRAENERRFGVVWAATIGATLLSYLFYAPFGIWWYLRFLLPAWPFAAVSIACLIATATKRMSATWERQLLAALLCAPFVTDGVRTAIDRGAFGLRQGEDRFVKVGQLVRDTTPAGAFVIADHHSGSVRYYGGRRTLRLSYIAPESLLEGSRQLGREQPVYLLLEPWEEAPLRDRLRAAGADLPSPVATAPDGNVRLFALGGQATR